VLGLEKSPIIIKRKKRNRKKVNWLLPDHKEPYFEESRISYLKRISNSNFTSYTQFYANTLGLSRSLLRYTTVNYYLPHDVINQLAIYTKVNRQQLEKTGLERWLATLPNLCSLWRSRKNQYICLECLADKPAYYRREWSLGFVTTCFEHHRLLIDRCPNTNCKKPYRFWLADWKSPVSSCHYCKCSIEQQMIMDTRTKLRNDDPLVGCSRKLLETQEIRKWKDRKKLINLRDYFTGLHLLAMFVNRILSSNKRSQLPQSKMISKTTLKLYESHKGLLKRFQIAINYPEVNHVIMGIASHLLKEEEDQLSKIIALNSGYFNIITAKNCPEFLKKYRNPRTNRIPNRARIKIKNESKLKYAKETEKAIQKIKNRGYPITEKSVAEEIGITVITLRKYPIIRNKIEIGIENYVPEYEWPEKKKQTAILPDNADMIVKECIETLIFDIEPISYAKIEANTKIPSHYLSSNMSLRNLIASGINRQSDYWKTKITELCENIMNEEQDITYETVGVQLGINRKRVRRIEGFCEVVDSYKKIQSKNRIEMIRSAIENLKKQNEIIRYTRVAEKLNKPMKYITENSEYHDMVEKEQQVQREELLATMKEEIDRLVSKKGRISCKSIALRLNIPHDFVLENSEFNQVIQEGKSRLLKSWKESVEAACIELIEEGREVNYLATAIKLGINVNRIKRNSKLRKIIDNHRNERLWINERLIPVKSVINSLKRNNERITFAKVAKIMNRPSYYISKNDDFYQLVAKEQEKQKEEWIASVQKEVEKRKTERKRISSRTVASELNIPCHIVQRDKSLNEIIRYEREELQNLLEEDVRTACEQITSDNREVNFKEIAGIMSINPDRLKKNHNLRKIVNEYRSYKQRIDDGSQRDDCSNIKPSKTIRSAIEELKKKNEIISFVKVADLLSIPVREIAENRSNRIILEEEMTHQRNRYRLEVKKTVDQLVDERNSISYQKISSRMSISAKMIRTNKELRKIVIDGKERLNKIWRDDIISACNEISANDKVVNYKNVAIKLNIGVGSNFSNLG